MALGPATYPTVTPGDVVFSASEFLAQYPSFSTVPTPALQGNFNIACLQLQNSAASVVQDAPTRQYFLYLLTAHITALLNGVNGEAPSGVVGRISNATQGSISVTAEWAASVSNSAAYYNQTQWGATYWQSTVSYRTARYVPPQRSTGYGVGAWNDWPQ